MTSPTTTKTDCCIVGGGPAGLFLGFLLARSGVDVIVMEKHNDFLRDFRGDTIHPSTFELLHELGFLEEFLELTDFRVERLRVCFEGRTLNGPDFSQLPTKCRFIGFSPQWEFLNFIRDKAMQYPTFKLLMKTSGLDVVRQGGRVRGVRYENDDNQGVIHSTLVVAADGRSSTIRRTSGSEVIELGVPIDVLWFRLDRPVVDDQDTLGWLKDGHALVTIPRANHYQVAMIIRKGAFGRIREDGLSVFRQTIGTVCPLLRDVADNLQSWDEVKLLTVQINRMKTWHEPGMLFIGDAAHAMSPAGGVGINLALQDAVAAANVLVDRFQAGTVDDQALSLVQQRRASAARKTQRLQAFIHNHFFGGNSSPGKPIAVPWYLRLLIRLFGKQLRKRAARIIGIGFQPEHIQTWPAERWGE